LAAASASERVTSSLPVVLPRTCSKGAEVKRTGVSVVDRDEPEASCWEWHGDGTAGEDDRASHLAAVAPARAMGEARPRRHELVGKPLQTARRRGAFDGAGDHRGILRRDV
jgi:hypothetical protein